MEHLSESRTNRWLKAYDKTLENTAWAGIVASCVFKNIVPFHLKERTRLGPNLFDDRRMKRRLNVERTVNCIHNNLEMDRGRLLNISTGGMYVETDRPADIGQELTFDLSGRNMSPFMRVLGRVMRRSDRGMAVKFV